MLIGYPLAAVERFDRAGGDPRIDLLAQEVVRPRVEVSVDRDVVVETNPAALPVRVLVGHRQQGQQRRTVELL